MKYPLGILLLCIGLSGLPPGQAFGADTRVEGQVIVQLEAGPGLRDASADQLIAGELRLEMIKVLSPRLGLYLLGFDPEMEAAEGVLRRLRQHPRVAAAQFNYRVAPRDAPVFPNDPLFERQWGLRAIDAPDAWEITTGGKTTRNDDIVVAILDAGYEVTHRDLRDNIWINRSEIPNDGIDNDGNGYTDDISGWNFIDDSPVHGTDYHGTSVSGIIGARGNNSLGVTGINWDVQLMLFDIQFVDEIISSYSYVIEQRRLYNQTNGQRGAFVVATNASIGLDRVFCSEQPIWGAMYDLLGQVGVLTAAGPANTNYNVDEEGDMPTTCPSNFLLATLNVNPGDEKHANSAWGPIHIDIGSPGQGSFSTGLNDGYRMFNGNSAAIPHLAGAIAFLYSMPCPFLAESALAQPAQTALLIRQAILDGVDPLDDLIPYTATGGRLNLLNSLRQIDGRCEGTTGPMNILNLYPNPANQNLRVDFETPDFESYLFEVFNALGQRVYAEEVTPSRVAQKTLTIPVNNFASGMYVVRMRRGDRAESRKFLVIPR